MPMASRVDYTRRQRQIPIITNLVGHVIGWGDMGVWCVGLFVPVVRGGEREGRRQLSGLCMTSL